MATVSTAFKLIDNMSRPIQAVNRSVSTLVSIMETAQSTFNESFDPVTFQSMKNDLADAAAGFRSMQDDIRQAENQEEQFKREIEETAGSANALGSKLKGILATVGSIATVKMGFSWMKENLELADTQRDAENQLAAVLANMGGTQTDYQAILDKASSIQGAGIYGDEAMIAGAAELSTYFKDSNAIMSMMDTLSDYAMGMSGGGELDKTAMVDYATNIGKIMTGSYEAMTKKGFEFTDTQKAIIEGTATQQQIVDTLGEEYLDCSEDMQAAAAINSVIAESWDGLYETMSNTPEGQIIQFNNRIGDLRETLGNRIYPAVLQFYGVFNSNFPQVKQVLTALSDLLGSVVVILGWLAKGALNVATVIVDNWSWIAPLLMGAAAALGAYWTATKGVTIAQKTAEGATIAFHAVVNFLSIGFGVLTGNTAAASAAVFTFNSALLANPIVWVVGLIMVLVAALYAGVAAYNKFAGAGVSATGIIAGAFSVLGAFLINTFIVPLQNALAMIANFLGNVFNNPIAAVEVLFYDMCLTVIGYISNVAHAIENVINKIPGVTVDITSGLGNFYNGLEQVQQKVKDESGWVEYARKMDYIDYSDAASAGYKFGEGIADKISGAFALGNLDSSMAEYNWGNAANDIAASSADTAGNTASIADSMGDLEDNLAYMIDIAEREAVNRFTTAEITVEQHNENHIDKDVDVAGIMDAWAADFAEKLDVSGEGV